MKTLTSLFLIVLFLAISGCTNPDCPTDPLTNDDITGFIDGSTGILFTTAADKLDVLASLEAEPHTETTYRMPIFEIGEQQVFLIFKVEEVEQPSAYMEYEFVDYCYSAVFQEFENELMELIEMNEENLEDQFIIACGDAMGQIGDDEEEKQQNVKGKEQETLDKLKKNKQAKKELKNELAETAKKKGIEAKQALNNGDKDKAKEKAKELVEESKKKFTLKLDYKFCEDWKFGVEYGYWYTEPEPEIPPELINAFTNQNIRYRVYKSAECGPGPPTLSLICYNSTPIRLDSTRPPPPPVWTSQEHLPRDVCRRGTGFCVEQEVVYLIERDYSDSLCNRLINVRPYKDFACFK